ncbi:MAG: hypothetical protein COT15_00145 [Candidatus Diapherotrites archaeon CG08_land_8_20_14_0_20_34_12]|nr:MAG: hypothetical protein COT15_00145 [Candidatus Diapherotrites archaeon CG08_land_8_20_14_0_20_34_12]
MTKHHNPKQHKQEEHPYPQGNQQVQHARHKKTWKEKLSFLRWIDPFTYVDVFILPKINPNENKLITNIVYVISAFIFAYLFYQLFGLILASKYPATIVLSGSMEPVFYRGDILIVQGVSSENLKGQEVSLDLDSLENVPTFFYANGFCSLDQNPSLVKCLQLVNPVLTNKIPLENFTTKEIRFSNGVVLPIETTGDIVVYYSKLQNKEIVHRVIAKIKTKSEIYVLTKGDSKLNPFIDQEGGIVEYAINAKDIYGRVIFKIPILGYVKLLLLDDPIQLIQGCYMTNSCVFP